jgi:hypothetical protein
MVKVSGEVGSTTISILLATRNEFLSQICYSV